MSSGSSGGKRWSIVARCDPADGDIISAHNGNVQILITFFGVDVLRQRSEIVAAVKDAAESALDGKFLERVIEAANTKVRAARPLNSNQGASIAIAYQDDEHELTSLALGKCQVWISRSGVLESTNAYPDIYLGEFGLNAGRRLALEKPRVESAQKPRVVLAPAGYSPSARAVQRGWLTLFVIAAFLVVSGAIGIRAFGQFPPAPTTPTPNELPPVASASPTLTLAVTPTEAEEPIRTAAPSSPASATPAPSPTRIPTSTPIPTLTPLPSATPTATITLIVGQSPGPDVTAGEGITPTITLVLNCPDKVFTNTPSGESIPIECTVSGELPDPYLLEMVIWPADADDPESNLKCFLDKICGWSTAPPQKNLQPRLDLLGLSRDPRLAKDLARGKRYTWAVFIVFPNDPETSVTEYKRFAPVNIAGFNGRYPEFEFGGASEGRNERPDPTASPTVACIPGQDCGGLND